MCPRSDCGRLFIAYYGLPPMDSKEIWRLLSCKPGTHRPRRFADHVAECSPGFVEIYNEALHAESLGLLRVCGPGYRKAMEFLIKDYLIAAKPDDAAKIRSLPLGKCISELVDNENVKSCAAMAAWLGNDETHYERKWTDKDLKDFKNLIDLTVSWIENERRTAAYKKDMQGGG